MNGHAAEIAVPAGAHLHRQSRWPDITIICWPPRNGKVDCGAYWRAPDGALHGLEDVVGERELNRGLERMVGRLRSKIGSLLPATKEGIAGDE